jgi:hypothetical protein
MKQFSKYDPEDIESLLLHKQFNELYPEEKEFVLRHLDGVEEYESMRRMLLELKNSEGTDEWLMPDPSIKKALMAEFARERKGRFSIWLNSLFAMPDRPFYTQRGVQWSFGVALVAGAFFFLKPNSNQTILAEKQNTEVKDSLTAKMDTIKQTEGIVGNQKTVVDTSMSNVIPAAPKVLAMVVSAPQNKPEESEVIFDNDGNSNAGADTEKAESVEPLMADEMAVETKDASMPSVTSTNANSTMFQSSDKNVQMVATATAKYDFSVAVNAGSMANYSDLLDIMFTAK